MNKKRGSANHVGMQPVVARPIALGALDATKGKRLDYVIEVYRPIPTWLTEPGDEDELGLLAISTDPEMAIRYTDHGEARRAVKAAVRNHPAVSFRLGVLAPLPQKSPGASAT